MKTFYRVCNPTTEQGLWYDFKGNFTGLIHNEFNFCKNTDLKMDYDPELVKWLSATESIDDLFQWFTFQDILNLQDRGWYVHEYETENFKFYNRFKHFTICQTTSILKRKIELYKVSIDLS
jgi:hypothetical protein